MRSTYRRVGVIAALALVSSLALAGTAAANHPGGIQPPTATVKQCGDTITADTVLAADVGPCDAATGTNGALTITASGTAPDPLATPPTLVDYVTLDLNGHKVYGCDDDTPQGPCNYLDVNDPSLVGPYVTGEGPGIVIDGQDYVKITDSAAAFTDPQGTVKAFDTGIVLRGGSNNVIEKLDVNDNVGTALTDSDYGEGIGIYTKGSTGSTNNVVKANTVEGNGPFGGIALYNYDDQTGTQNGACTTPTPPNTNTHSNTIGGPTSADGNTVKNNYVVPNGTSFQDDGIRIEPQVCKTTVQNNTVSGSSLEGVAVFADAWDSKVLNNVVQANGNHPLLTQRKGDGIRVFLRAQRTTVKDNTVCGNAGSGVSVDTAVNSSGVVTYPLTTPTDQRSTIQNNKSGTGTVPGTGPPETACARNAVGPGTSLAYDLLEGGHPAVTGAADACRHIWSGNSAGLDVLGSLSAYPTCTAQP